MSNKIRKDKKTGRKVVALIFVFISVFCSVFFAARSKFNTTATDGVAMAVVAPFQRAFSWVGSQLAFVKNTVDEMSRVHEQNKQLREEDSSQACVVVSIQHPDDCVEQPIISIRPPVPRA